LRGFIDLDLGIAAFLMGGGIASLSMGGGIASLPIGCRPSGTFIAKSRRDDSLLRGVLTPRTAY
jgi:hypothetical protein